MVKIISRLKKQLIGLIIKFRTGEDEKTFQFLIENFFKLYTPIFIRPYFEFGASLWNNFSKENINKIEGIQKGQQKWLLNLDI